MSGDWNSDFMKYFSKKYGVRSTGGVPQMVPQPAGIPWSINGMSWGSSSTSPVAFTARPLDRDRQSAKFFSSGGSGLHCKRKAETEATARPRKQLVTEEKMSASFDCMHISRDYTTHSIHTGNVDDESGGMDLEMQGPRIILSPELLKVQPEPILPPSIVSRLENPCTSLVLWRPPKKILETSEEHKDPNNNPDKQRDLERSEQRKGILGAMLGDYSGKACTSKQDSACGMDVEM